LFRNQTHQSAVELAAERDDKVPRL